MSSNSVIVSGAPAEFISKYAAGRGVEELVLSVAEGIPRMRKPYMPRQGSFHEAASRELPKAAMKNETYSGSFDSSSSRQAGTLAFASG